jgi:hypothetical protein
VSLDVSIRGTVDKESCSACGASHKIQEEVFSANITHNLQKMASVAGIYQHLWDPEKIGVTHAWQLIAPLQEALDDLRSDPTFFQAYDSPNGWGRYENFVPWLERYLRACIEYPNYLVSVSR